MLLLLAPVMAFAQSGASTGEESLNEQVARSPLTWSWVVMLAVAVAAFVAYTVKISRNRRPPDHPSVP
ncbi:hypothetical protein D187_007028 [Cystobacter fuscus DSM 2262]|uniref:Uncharacterized protein n=2 Tax=Cystobacter fuscus TaxID=43 RepID=S9Q7H4_CYSF2|nr:hypothetical protein D187_007028 [Cystobacter fuscus DSM 2262]